MVGRHRCGPTGSLAKARGSLVRDLLKRLRSSRPLQQPDGPRLRSFVLSTWREGLVAARRQLEHLRVELAVLVGEDGHELIEALAAG